MAKFISNKQRQEELNIEKYYASMEANRDLSGQRFYCTYCSEMKDGKCTTKQSIIDEQTLCAKAYNKYKRSTK